MNSSCVPYLRQQDTRRKADHAQDAIWKKHFLTRDCFRDQVLQPLKTSLRYFIYIITKRCALSFYMNCQPLAG